MKKQDCQKIRSSINAYIDGMDDRCNREEVEMHLRACVECRRMVELSKSAGEFMKQNVRKMPREVHDNTMRIVRNYGVQVQPVFYQSWVGYTVAGFIAVCLIIGLIPQVVVNSSGKKVGVEILTPEAGAVVYDSKTDVCARVKVKVKGATVRVYVDKQDVTSTTEFVDDYLWYRPIKPLKDGYHSIDIQTVDRKGEIVAETEFSFIMVSK
ncbi:MAG: zf-HC2 domain-containing protein [Elusimicrobiota bacterium]